MSALPPLPEISEQIVPDVQRPQCSHKMVSGKGCGAPCMRKQNWCWFHSPEYQQRKAAISAMSAATRLENAAARNRSAAVLRTSGEVELTKPRDVLLLIGKTLTLLRRGVIEAEPARAIFAGCNVALTVFKQEGTDNRVDKLEEQMRPLKGLSKEHLTAYVDARRVDGPPSKAEDA